MGIVTQLSNIGHGQLGLRCTRSLYELYKESACQKHVFVDIFGGKLITGWTVDSGSVYKATVNETLDGRSLDVVKLMRGLETYVRVDSRAAVVAGTYYYDSMATGARTLYVQQSDNGDPTAASTFACFGFYVGNVGMIHPILGPDLMVDGDVELWGGVNSPTNYSVATNVGDSNSSITRDSTVVYQGAFSARLGATLTQSGSYRWRINSEIATVPGLMYQFSGKYRADPTNGPSITPLIVVGHGSNLLTSDGITVVSSGAQLLLVLTDVRDGWAHFSFNFVAFDTTVNLTFGLNNPVTGGTQSGKVWFDRLRFRRIYRFEYYEPRLDISSIPTLSKGRGGINFESHFINTGTLTLQNGEAGALETMFGQYDFGFQDLTMYHGGKAMDGDEILLEDMKVERFIQQEPHVTDEKASIQLRGPQSMFEQIVPFNRYNVGTYPNLCSIDNGRSRMLIFGNALSIRPARIDKDGTTAYGKYEGKDASYLLTGDTAFNPTLIGSTGGFRVYLTASDADNASNYFVALSESGSVYINTSGQVLKDIKAIWVKAGVNDMLDFDKGGANLPARVATPGFPAGAIYTMSVQSNLGVIARLIDAIGTALTAAGGGAGMSSVYSDTTHKVTLGYNPGPFNMRATNAAANSVKSILRTIGYTANADYLGPGVGAITFTSDAALFLDADSDHIIRMEGYGCCYIDDSSGTYTGSASAKIEKAGDILYFLLRNVMNVPLSQINTADIAALRSGAFNLGAVIGGAETNDLTFDEIVQRLEQSGLFDMVHDGDQWRFTARNNTVPGNVLDVYDRDIMGDMDGFYTADDIVVTVTVKYGYQQSTDHWKTNETQSSAAKVRRNRIVNFREFRTWILADADAVTRTTSFSVNLFTKRRRFHFILKGVGMGLKPGDMIRINRSVYVGRAGDANNQLVVRVINITFNWETWETAIEAAEVLLVTNGY